MNFEVRNQVQDYHQHVQAMEEIHTDAKAEETAEMVEQEHVDEIEISEEAPHDPGLLAALAAKVFQYGKA